MGSHRNQARKRQGAAKLKELEEYLSILLAERYSSERNDEIYKTREAIEQLRMLLARKGTFVPPADLKPPEKKVVVYGKKPRIVPKWENPGPITTYFDEKFLNLERS
jgi:hypothetical protein